MKCALCIVMAAPSKQLHYIRTAFAGICDIIPSQVIAAVLESLDTILASGGVPLSVPLRN